MSDISSNYKIFYRLWLTNADGKSILGDGKIRLLNKIQEEKSLSSAAAALGMSYRKAWGDIKKAEETLGFELTIKARGGNKGGGSCLSPKGKQLIQAYTELHNDMKSSVDAAYGKFNQTIENLPEEGEDEGC